MYDSICVMLPTYGRSGTLLPTFINSCMETASDVNHIKFAFCLNQKDVETDRFLKLFKWPKKENLLIVYESTDKPNLSLYFNMLYRETTVFGDNCLVSMLGDDMEFRTPGWDKFILDAVNMYNGIGIFWCNDNYIAHERCAVNLFVTRKMVDATEHPFMCEEFAGDMIDYLWTKVGKYTRTQHYFPDVIIQHNHNTSLPKEQWDATFNRLRPAQAEGHAVGKPRAKQIAHEISDILIRKGLVGNSI